MTAKPLLDVLEERMPERRPVWFMRQAGRYLPEYRALRSKAGSFLDLCYNSALAAEVTLQPVSRFDIDGAIVFADILVVPHAMGVELRFAEGEGPILERIVTAERVARLEPLRRQLQVQAVCQTTANVRAKLPREVALIGFCGAPWTVASYMIEGGSSEGRAQARLAAYHRPMWFVELIERLIDASIEYLARQIEAGAEVVQIFDSWAGDLPGRLHEEFVVEPIRRICAALQERCGDVPVIVFARGAGLAHKRIAETSKAKAVGVETTISLGALHDLLPANCAIQGNLDPFALEAGGEALKAMTRDILGEVPFVRHIFNLGHGIRPDNNPSHVSDVIRIVREFDSA